MIRQIRIGITKFILTQYHSLTSLHYGLRNRAIGLSIVQYRSSVTMIPIVLLVLVALTITWDFFRGPERTFKLLEDRNVPQSAPWWGDANFGLSIDIYLDQSGENIDQVILDNLAASIPGMPKGVLEEKICIPGFFLKPALVKSTNFSQSIFGDEDVAGETYFLGENPNSPNIFFQGENPCSFDFEPPTASASREFVISPEAFNAISIVMESQNSHFFPFDSLVSKTPLVLWVPSRYENEISYPLNMRVHTNLPDWNEKIGLVNEKVYLTQEQSDETTIDAKLISITLKRPLRQQILTVILLLFMAVFITSLIYVDDRGSALEVSVGILFGLWGVGSILLPENVSINNLVGLGLTLLYIYFAGVAFYRFVARESSLPFSLRLPDRSQLSEENDNND
ncbi:MAG: hypothetical protein IPM53_29930 [Anaerolineaceae bacterium]|nr:hypothetical protein [Anaerolineaceae bacterium]